MSIIRPIIATGFALVLCAAAARADIPVTTARSADDALAEEVIAEAVNCVGAVLAYQVDMAEAICTRVITALPDEALGYKFRGLAYLLAHRFDRAEPDFREAVRLAPEDPENQAGYGQALSGLGRYGESIVSFDRALALAPDDVRFLAARCWARAGEGHDLAGALTDCNRAVDLAPTLAGPRANRGLVRLKQQNWRAAIQDYTRALDLDALMPSALFGRGYAYARLADMDQARADIGAARRLDPSIDALFVRVGVLPFTCRTPGAACPLPQELRTPQASGQPGLMVSYRASPELDTFTDMDATIRTVALGRMQAMLERSAGFLGTRLRPDLRLSWDVTAPGEALRQLVRLQQEFRSQQTLACDGGVVSGEVCRMPAFHPSSTLVDAPFALRQEVEHTMNAIQPFWRSVCEAKQGRCVLE